MAVGRQLLDGLTGASRRRRAERPDRRAVGGDDESQSMATPALPSSSLPADDRDRRRPTRQLGQPLVHVPGCRVSRPRPAEDRGRSRPGHRHRRRSRRTANDDGWPGTARRASFRMLRSVWVPLRTVTSYDATTTGMPSSRPTPATRPSAWCVVVRSRGLAGQQPVLDEAVRIDSRARCVRGRSAGPGREQLDVVGPTRVDGPSPASRICVRSGQGGPSARGLGRRLSRSCTAERRCPEGSCAARPDRDRRWRRAHVRCSRGRGRWGAGSRSRT